MKKREASQKNWQVKIIKDMFVSGQKYEIHFQHPSPKRVNYSKGSTAPRMTNVIQEVQKHPGLPISIVAITYGVSRMFLSDRVSGKVQARLASLFYGKASELGKEKN